MSDEDIWRLNRGGHDPYQGPRGLRRAMRVTRAPTVILAKTVKGYGMGEAGEGQNITHSQKKMGIEALKAFRDRFNIPIDDQILGALLQAADADSPEMNYMHERRRELGGLSCRARRREAKVLPVPGLDAFKALLERQRRAGACPRPWPSCVCSPA
jgi:pyruvate dehydrogenase E1 component